MRARFSRYLTGAGIFRFVSFLFDIDVAFSAADTAPAAAAAPAPTLTPEGSVFR